MAERGIVARPYAQALFEIAQGDGQLAAWSDFLRLAAAMVAEPGVTRLMFTPGADLMRLAATMTEICREQLGDPAPLKGGERSTAANFLRLLVQNQRLSALPDISARFEALKADAENTLEVTLTTASHVNAEQQARIVVALRQRFNRDIRLDVRLDPDLIGGARLQVGDRVVDGSIRTGLDKLATALRA
jgi:F-type H+-transporting ATPase subunit delta